VVRARVGAGRGLEEQVRADLEPVLAGLGAEGGTMRLFAIGAARARDGHRRAGLTALPWPRPWPAA